MTVDIKFDLPFAELIAFFRSKGIEISPGGWRDIWQQANARAFTVARVTDMDVLQDIRKALDEAMESGQALAAWRKQMRETLEKKGWFAPEGEDAWVTLPDGTRIKRLTGWRLDLIYQANMASAYQSGRYKQLQDVKGRRPYWQYMTAQDPSVRDEHAAMHGRVWHADHPIWDTWYPPNGWHCRCYVKALSERQMKQRGLTEETRGVAETPNEGWRYNVGEAGLDAWTPDLEKYAEALKEQYLRDLEENFERQMQDAIDEAFG